MANQQRTIERLKAHYEIEQELSNRLRHSTRQERKTLYTAVYDELFRRVPDHPMLTQKATPDERANAVATELGKINRFLNEDSRFLEVGPGDCALSLAVAARVKQVYAIEVSEELTRSLASPPNFQLIISDGCSIPVPPSSVDLAYSNQLMEHLHPDDATEQLRNIYRALAPGGMYLCFTPNRFSGPHDVSTHFDRTATGFHLREYSITELRRAFRQAGFSTVRLYVRTTLFPTLPMRVFETLLTTLPYALRRRVASQGLAARALGIQLVGIKSK